jgi:hypothetical protein
VQIFLLLHDFLRMRVDLHEMTVVLGALEDLMAQFVPVLLVLPLHRVLTHLPGIQERSSLFIQRDCLTRRTNINIPLSTQHILYSARCEKM